jgi:hypothetical protein
MAFYTTFDAVFWTGIATMSFAFFGVVIKAMLSSKCDNVNLCCGLIHIHRNVELENQIELQNQAQTQPTESQNGIHKI